MTEIESTCVVFDALVEIGFGLRMEKVREREGDVGQDYAHLVVMNGTVREIDRGAHPESRGAVFLSDHRIWASLEAVVGRLWALGMDP